MAGNPFKKTPFPKFKDVENLNKEEAAKEVEQLREAIHHHNYLYYVKNQSEIADSAFDKLFNRLENLESAFPKLQSDLSPTRKVGAPPVDELKKKKHRSPMLSLKSSVEKKEVTKFLDDLKKNNGGKRPDLMLEPKFDGLSVEVVYKDGNFQYATTRGDGDTGEDISENLKTISSLPLKLRSNQEVPGDIAVRGEVFMDKEGFAELNKQRVEKGEEPFANARNAAAGTLRQLDSKKVAGKPLDIFFYEVLASKTDRFDRHEAVLKQFPEWGLKVSPENKKCNSMDDLDDYYNDLLEKRDDLPYEIDGVVIKADDHGLREDLGSRHRNPRWAYAWKFPPKKEVTLLRDIVVQVGRTGILTPVALLDPVNIGGVTVSRATLHNENEVAEKDVRPGDTVRIMRAGDVIPEIVERVEKKKRREKPFRMPKKCPVCDTEVIREGAYVICPAGLSCRAQIIGRIRHFASNNALNIDMLGEKITEQLVRTGKIEKLPDLFRLSPEDLEDLEGFAKKSAQKLVEEIERSKEVELHRFLYALGIRHVGEHISRVLATEFGSLEEIKKADYDRLLEVNEIGPGIAESISNFFDTKENRKMVDELMSLGVKVKTAKKEQKKHLKGVTVVITGELESFTRDEAKEEIEARGGRATSSVSSHTDYLVKGSDPGSKLDDAEKENVKIISEQQFKSLLKGD